LIIISIFICNKITKKSIIQNLLDILKKVTLELEKIKKDNQITKKIDNINESNNILTLDNNKYYNEINNLLLNNTQDINISRNSTILNETNNNDNKNIIKFLKNKLKTKDSYISNLVIMSKINYITDNETYDIKKFTVKGNYYKNNKELNQFTFDISMLFYVNNNEIFISDYKFNNKNGIFKINYTKLMNFDNNIDILDNNLLSENSNENNIVISELNSDINSVLSLIPDNIDISKENNLIDDNFLNTNI